jgi:aspartate/methionine/tyrosine aminotransferase
VQLHQSSVAELQQWESELAREYAAHQAANLNLDLTRGKPSAEQLSLSDALDGILGGNFKDEDGNDVRNYGTLEGIVSARRLFAQFMQVQPDEIIVAGNSSLTLMYQTQEFAMYQGLPECEAWSKQGGPVKFLAPVPGYDRHFGVSQHLGIELVPVAMNDNGPDMDQVEALVAADPMIKGIWCVPRFSNPTGIVYSDSVVERLARLPKIAGKGFRIFWDNAYAYHILDEDAPELADIFALAKQFGTADNIYMFGSTSKITFAGAGVAFLAATPANLKEFLKHVGWSQINPDKVNQLRHVRFLKNMDGVRALMKQHAALLKPRFDAVLQQLSGLNNLGMASWTEPRGGYFISVDVLPGLAKQIVKMAADAGVKLTPAGATWPAGNDPQDRNIRLAPSVPTVPEIVKATEVFVTCVKLASVRQELAKRS